MLIYLNKLARSKSRVGTHWPSLGKILYIELAMTGGNESRVPSVWLAAFLDRVHIILLSEGHRVDYEQKTKSTTLFVDNLHSPKHETKLFFSELL